ncbi:hypothetical protein KL86DYS2_13353 [uncultured Dysgonomonas sp.]|uniref:Septin-type G domain-containing protein n=1 Tax=uncultured Dysgonomonas sp. TaxID=206096 RepID=A0A212K9N1_9BACT|nr:GTPase domain-containing protein [uncultured Dysgonomonas sp.]SBW08352.1 hypothetical protein KL86DYS2_13353 [uncultured Dysgonomonas sp.]
MSQLNIVVIGKSGVGKSSLLNYLVDKEIFETGVGAPVTSEYFKEYRFTSLENNIEYNLFDTKGIEPSTTEEFLLNIRAKINEYDSCEDIYQMIHTIYYCIASSSKRLEPFEIELINELSEFVTIVLILTKSDLAKGTDIIDMKKYINDVLSPHVQIISICSIEQTTRKGTSLKFGREEVLKHSFMGLWEKLAKILPTELDSLLFYGIKIPTILKTSVNNKLRQYYEQIEIPIPYASSELYLGQLLTFPSLEDLELNNLYQEDLLSIEQLVDCIFCFSKISSNQIDELLIDLKNKRQEKINDVLNFYSRITKQNAKPIITRESDKTLNNLNNLFKEKLAEIESVAKENKTRIKKIKNSSNFFEWTLNLDGRDELRSSYEDLGTLLSSLLDDLGECILEYENSYKIELIQYGYLILKQDEECFDYRQGTINSEIELSKNDRIYYEVLLKCYRNLNFFKGGISRQQRFVLEQLIDTLNISYIRAGLIEDLINSQKMY